MRRLQDTLTELNPDSPPRPRPSKADLLAKAAAQARREERERAQEQERQFAEDLVRRHAEEDPAALRQLENALDLHSEPLARARWQRRYVLLPDGLYRWFVEEGRRRQELARLMIRAGLLEGQDKAGRPRASGAAGVMVEAMLEYQRRVIVGRREKSKNRRKG